MTTRKNDPTGGKTGTGTPAGTPGGVLGGGPGGQTSERVPDTAPSPQVAGRPAPHYVSDYGGDPTEATPAETDRRLDHGVKGTFPASDPPALDPPRPPEPRPTVEQLEAELAAQRAATAGRGEEENKGGGDGPPPGPERKS